MMKRAAFEVARITGVAQLTCWLTRSTPRIFMYHRFSRDGDDERVNCASFATQLRRLRASHRLLTLRQLCEVFVGQGRFPDRCAVITVDDGYQDFYEHAFPILTRLGVPASLFITTDFIDGQAWLWPDQLRFILAATSSASLDVHENDVRFAGSLRTTAERRAAWAALNEACMEMQDHRLRRFICGLSAQLEVSIPDRPPIEYAPLTWPQLRELDAAGIEIGGHTMTHPSLTRVTQEQLVREIEGSAQRITDMLGKPPATFCYPIGRRSDIDEGVKSAVRRAGFMGAVAAYSDTNVGDDLFELRRYPGSNSIYEFEKARTGLRFLKERLTRSPKT